MLRTRCSSLLPRIVSWLVTCVILLLQGSAFAGRILAAPPQVPPSSNGAGGDATDEAAVRFRKTREAAEGGDAIAQYKLAFLYEDGTGVAKDEAQAVLWYRRSAEQGLSEAQCNLGVRYWDGRGVAQDEAEAVRWYRLSAAQDNRVAQNNLGVCYDTGRGVAQDDIQAVHWYRKSAEQGYVSAQWSLGQCYYLGQGVAKDDVEAVKWYRRAAQQREPRSQCQLGVMYAKGRGVPQDLSEAIYWYQESAKQGFATAQYNLGIVYSNGKGVRRDDATAVAWFRKAAEQGLAGAQADLGTMYEEGRGVPRDAGEAVAWFRRGAEQGDAGAQNNLGIAYRYGRGVPKDPVEAIGWYRRSAEQGDANAQYNLALAYDLGEGVSQDVARAVLWYGKSAEHGQATAQFNLALCYENGRGVEKDLAKAASLYRLSAEQGYAPAQSNLAILYEQGAGVPKDVGEAIAWYRKAAAGGEANAKYGLGNCYWRGDGVKQDFTEAVRWYRRSASQGLADAQFMLGHAHESGQGAILDPLVAVSWYRKSADLGFEDAKQRLHVLTASLTSDQLQQLRSRQLAEDARKRFLAGDHSGAIMGLEDAIALHPDDAFLHASIAHLRGAMGDHSGALVAAGRSIQLDPKSGAAFMERGFVRNQQGDRANAMRDLDRAVRLAPGLAMAWGVRGDVRRQAGEHARAVRDYTQAIDLDPGFTAACVGRGLCQFQLGDFLTALEDFRLAASTLPEEHEPVKLCALTERELGRPAEAYQTLATYLETHPSATAGFLVCSVLAQSQGDWAAAERHLRSLLTKEKNAYRLAEAHQHLGGLAFLQGDLERAMAEFTMARSEPVMAPWAALMQWLLLVAKEPEAAAKSLPRTDDDALVRTLLALCREGRGDSEQLPVSHLKAAEACALLFFSGWKAETQGRRNEAAWKLLRCVNSGAREMLQWEVAAHLLARWSAEQPLKVGYGCSMEENGSQGQLVVTTTVPWGAAAAQGLQVGDLVTRIQCSPASLKNWAALPGNTDVGLRVRLAVVRGGKERILWLFSGYEPTPSHQEFAPAAAEPVRLLSASPTFTAETPNGWRKQAEVDTSRGFSQQLVHHFGAGAEVYIGTIGGNVDQSIESWLRMFGKPPLDAAALSALPRTEFLGQDVRVLEIAGDYKGIDGERKDSRMIVVLSEHGKEIVFVRCLGPNQEVAEQREALLAFAASVRSRQ